jgi:hypothetical protein
MTKHLYFLGPVEFVHRYIVLNFLFVCKPTEQTPQEEGVSWRRLWWLEEIKTHVSVLGLA